MCTLIRTIGHIRLHGAGAYVLTAWRPPSPAHGQHPRRSNHSRGNAAARQKGTNEVKRRGSILTLAIETSCDDTCVAILEKREGTAVARLLFNERITADSRRYRGIHPVAATESHSASLGSLVRRSLRFLPAAAAGAGAADVIPVVSDDDHRGDCRGGGNGGGAGVVVTTLRRKPDFVSVTRGPGMVTSLATGLNTAKGLAVAWGVPLVGVNHMQAHALTVRLVGALERWRDDDDDDDGGGGDDGTRLAASPSTASSPGGIADAERRERETADMQQGQQEQQQKQHTPAFPFLTLLVSGGHTMLVRSTALTEHEILANTIDIAVGDVIDKAARVILPPAWLDDGGAGQTQTPRPPMSYGALLERFAFPDGKAGFEEAYTAPRRRGDEIKVVSPLRPLHPSPIPPSDPPTSEGESQTGNDGTSHRYPWALRPPLGQSRSMRFAFASLNGDVQRLAGELFSGGAGRQAAATTTKEDEEAERQALAVETMRLAFEHLGSRVLLALEREEEASAGDERSRRRRQQESSRDQGSDARVGEADTTGPAAAAASTTLVVSGGVASNMFLRHVLRAMLEARGFAGPRRRVRLAFPPVGLCTDNAAMVAWAGVEMWEAGWETALKALPVRKWPVDPAAEGGGILGLDGWVRRKEGEGVR